MQIFDVNRCSCGVFEHNKINFKVLTHQVFFVDRRAILVFGGNLNLDFRSTTLKPLSELPLSESVYCCRLIPEGILSIVLADEVSICVALLRA